MIKVAAIPMALVLLTPLAPAAHAEPCNDQSCLQTPFAQAGHPYVGTWGAANNERVIVDADGAGRQTSDQSTVNFQMTFVSTSEPTAFGNVTDPNQGAFVTMHLVDNGNRMLFSRGGGDQNVPFCKLLVGSVNPSDCGA